MRLHALANAALVFCVLALFAGCGAPSTTCSSNEPLPCRDTNGDSYSCPYGNGGSTQVCCPQSASCSADGTCTTLHCPSCRPIACQGGFCCPYGENNSTLVCCPNNTCSPNGRC